MQLAHSFISLNLKIQKLGREKFSTATNGCNPVAAASAYLCIIFLKSEDE